METGWIELIAANHGVDSKTIILIAGRREPRLNLLRVVVVDCGVALRQRGCFIVRFFSSNLLVKVEMVWETVLG